MIVENSSFFGFSDNYVYYNKIIDLYCYGVGFDNGTQRKYWTTSLL